MPPRLWRAHFLDGVSKYYTAVYTALAASSEAGANVYSYMSEGCCRLRDHVICSLGRHHLAAIGAVIRNQVLGHHVVAMEQDELAVTMDRATQLGDQRVIHERRGHVGDGCELPHTNLEDRLICVDVHRALTSMTCLRHA